MMAPSEAHGREEVAGAVVSRPRASKTPRSPTTPARKATPAPGGHCTTYATARALNHAKLAVPLASGASGETLAAPPSSRVGVKRPAPGCVQCRASAAPRRGRGAGPGATRAPSATPTREGAPDAG